jgi:predicted nucleotidyltransferase
MILNNILKILENKKNKFNINKFVLFGSFANGCNHKNSDIDIAYILKDNFKLSFDNYLKLEKELTISLKNKIDLMNYKKLNPLIKLNAKKDFIYV